MVGGFLLWKRRAQLETWAITVPEKRGSIVLVEINQEPDMRFTRKKMFCMIKSFNEQKPKLPIPREE